MNHFSQLQSRRGFLTATGAAAALAIPPAAAFAQESDPAQQTAHEQANVSLVNDFCAAFETMDVQKLSAYFADDITFRMIDTAPRIDGRSALTAALTGFLATRSAARFDVLRSHAIGNVVINERIDHFTRKDGEDAFHVTGFFVVKDDKIVEWQDYFMPEGS